MHEIGYKPGFKVIIVCMYPLPAVREPHLGRCKKHRSDKESLSGSMLVSGSVSSMMLLNAAKDSNLISGRFKKSKVVVGCHFSQEIPLKRMCLEVLRGSVRSGAPGDLL